MWSPRPDVVLEISTDDMERTDRDLVDLAGTTSALELDEWEDVYSAGG